MIPERQLQETITNHTKENKVLMAKRNLIPFCQIQSNKKFLFQN